MFIRNGRYLHEYSTGCGSLHEGEVRTCRLATVDFASVTDLDDRHGEHAVVCQKSAGQNKSNFSVLRVATVSDPSLLLAM
jgi:hypothetical protein